MALAIALSLLLVALTAGWFITVKFLAGRRRTDLQGVAWSLVLALWFGYAAAWVLIHAHAN